MYGGTIDKLVTQSLQPYELLEPSATWREKSIDVIKFHLNVNAILVCTVLKNKPKYVAHVRTWTSNKLMYTHIYIYIH